MTPPPSDNSLDGAPTSGPDHTLATHLAWSMVRVVLLVLPPHAQTRYKEEFGSELRELPPPERVRYGLRVLCLCWSLRRATVAAAARQAPRQRSVLRTVVAGAGILVIAFSGVGVVAKSAQPGDRFWSLTKVLYADYARSVETAQKVTTELTQINRDVEEGRTTPTQAGETLERIQAQLAVVDEAQGHTQLATERTKLEEKLQVMPPSLVGP